MRMCQCQHCPAKFQGTGLVIEIVCPDCYEKGHRTFPHFCPVCNKPKPDGDDGGIKITLKKKELLKAA